MLYIIYNIFIFIVFILYFPFLIYNLLINKNKKESTLERMGFLSESLKKFINKKKSNKRIWVHAGSAGEIKLAKKIIEGLEDFNNDLSIIISYGGSSGKEMANKVLSDYKHFYLPFDLPLIIKRIVNIVEPDIFILIENDIWPNLIRELNKNNVKIALLNFAFNKNSIGAFKFLPPLLKKCLNKMDLISLQDSNDIFKLNKTGLKEDIIEVNGNMKFDVVVSNKINSFKQRLLYNNLNLQGSKNIIVAGSTHSGEEKILLNVFKKLKRKFDDLTLILAPRNIDRIKEIEDIAKKMKISSIRKSKIKDEKKNLIIVDSMGELSQLYSLAKVTFVGGTLIDKGGHNLLEAVLYGAPVLFGPYLSNVKLVSKKLINNDIGFEVNNEKELYNKIDILLEDSKELNYIKEKSKMFLHQHSGAIENNLKSIIKLGDFFGG